MLPEYPFSPQTAANTSCPALASTKQQEVEKLEVIGERDTRMYTGKRRMSSREKLRSLLCLMSQKKANGWLDAVPSASGEKSTLRNLLGTSK